MSGSTVFTTPMTIGYGGNIGIGTTSPAQKLEVNGNGLFDGDVCNGSGKCLSSVFQTNVIATGTNPTCPTGQTILMKAYNGTWYTADNPSITSWNKVTCGQVMTPDGTPFLVNGYHTQKNCTDASGTVVSDGAYNMCRFNSTSCGSWTQYNHWSTQSQSCTCGCDGCGINGNYGSGTCTPTPHAWSNTATASCYATIIPGYNGTGCNCTGALDQIGCY